MQYAVMFPIKFLDNYRDRIKAINRNIKYNPQVRLRKKLIYGRKDIIKKRDEVLIPVKSLLGSGLQQAEPLAIIVFIVTLPFMLGLFLSWLFFGPFILVWQRVIEVFSLEMEENTLTCLYLLPISTEELLEEKIKSATPYMGIYLVFGLFSFPLFLIAISIQSFHLSLIVLLSYFLYRALIYITILTVLKAKDMIKVTSLCVCLFVILLYLTVPFLSVLFYPAVHLLKKGCIQEISKIAEIND